MKNLKAKIVNYVRNNTRRQVLPEWEYIPGGWQERVKGKPVRGWDREGVADTLSKTWPSFIKSLTAPRPFSLSNESAIQAEPDWNFHNNVMNFAYVLALASKGKSKISVLDWGGGIGHYYKIARSLYPSLEIDYTCKDMPKLCEVGKKLIPEASFVTDEKDCLSQKYDLVMASTSLHYSKDWRRVLGRLIQCANQHIFVTRLPIAETKPSYVVIQRPYQYGYNTEYLGWCINKKEFLNESKKSGAILKRIFLCAESIVIPNAPEPAHYRGFLFEK